MDLQLIVTINVMAICGLAILLSLLQRLPGVGSWVAVNALVLVTGAVGLWLDSEWTGVAVAGLFVPLVLAPLVLLRLVQQRRLANRRAEAARFGRLAATLHPSRQWRFNAALLEADAIDDEDQRAAVLRGMAEAATARDRGVILLALRRGEDDWAGVLALCRAEGLAGPFAAYGIRALGELGQLEEMVEIYAAAKDRLAGVELATVQLFVLAFCGAPVAVERLLKGQLAALEPEAKAYWRAVAAKFAGEPEARWRAALEELAHSSANGTTRRAAARHAATPAAPGGLSGEGQARVAAVIDWVERRPAGAEPTWSGAPVTLALVALIGMVLVVEEWAGGSEDIATLVRLGAMWPPFVLERGEWWRLAAALFLHYGPLHAGLNALVLLALGPRIEARAGSAGMLATFVLGGLASMGAVLALMAGGVIGPAVLIGASGGVFALVGAELAARLGAWLRSREALDRRELLMLGLVIAIQTAVDLSVPQVSFAAHASGLLAGMLLQPAIAATLGRGRGR